MVLMTMTDRPLCVAACGPRIANGSSAVPVIRRSPEPIYSSEPTTSSGQTTRFIAATSDNASLS